MIRLCVRGTQQTENAGQTSMRHHERPKLARPCSSSAPPLPAGRAMGGPNFVSCSRISSRATPATHIACAQQHG